MRRLVLPLLLLFPAAALAGTRVDVPVADGTRLAADLYLPAGAGPFPTVLRRTPYGRGGPFVEVGDALASLGYAVVSQDERGRGDSEGQWRPFFDDGPDGRDTVAWIRAQPWSNGRVAGYGGSAEGIAVLLALGAGAELSCGVAFVATGDLVEGFWPGGAWRDELGTAWMTGMGALDSLREFRAHEARDAFWDPVRLDERELAAIDVPVLLVGGFFDIFAAGTPRTFAGLRAAGNGRAHLVLGPWTHEAGFSSTTQGELAFSATSTWDFGPEFLGFLDHCLRDGEAPAWEPVRYFVSRLADDGLAASGAWERADTWPPPSTPLALHLHEDGLLRRASPWIHGEPARIPVDPAAPIPSEGGGNLSTPAGPRDQAALDGRSDVAVFETPPASGTVRFAGDVAATIWAASDSTDGDVIARLSQVTPSGRVLLLADGIRRGRFVAGFDAIRPLLPGSPVPFELDLGPIAVDLPPGHALRLSIQGTSAPRYEPNPGTAAPLAEAPGPTASALTVFRDLDRASVLRLPLVSGELPEAPLAPDPDAGRDGAIDDSATACRCASSGGGPGVLALAVLAVLLVRRRR